MIVANDFPVVLQKNAEGVAYYVTPSAFNHSFGMLFSTIMTPLRGYKLSSFSAFFQDAGSDAKISPGA